MYFNMYIYSYFYVDHDYDTGFHMMVMLRSITGPYGRSVIEVAYGEMILSLHRGCMGDDSLGRVVGILAWCITHVWHTRINTSVGSVYILLFGFSRYKNLYVIYFQIYTYYKRILVVSDLVLARWGSENVFRPPKSFKRDLNHGRIYMFHCKQVLYLWIVLSFIYWFMIKLLVYSIMVKLFIFIISLFLTELI